MMGGGEGGGWCQAATYSSNHFVDIFSFCLCVCVCVCVCVYVYVYVCLRLCVLSFVPSSRFSQFHMSPILSTSFVLLSCLFFLPPLSLLFVSCFLCFLHPAFIFSSSFLYFSISSFSIPSSVFSS